MASASRIEPLIDQEHVDATWITDQIPLATNLGSPEAL
jgi:hypothetical protein